MIFMSEFAVQAAWGLHDGKTRKCRRGRGSGARPDRCPAMSKAGLASIAVFLAFALCGLALFALLRPFFLGVAAFVILGLMGSLIASHLFNQLATRDEKRRELEDRVRNSDL
jgi:hypothetical protein